MAYRTTEEAVGKLIELDDDFEMEPAIEGANYFVTELCVPPGVYSDATLELIERWLSAHMYAVLIGVVADVSVDVLRTRFSTNDKVDFGFRLTKYGQTALRFDRYGYLAAMDNLLDKIKTNPKGVGMTWLGSKCK